MSNSFKSFLLEYLTDEQRSRFSQVNMTDQAREGTDHFFGKDSDVVRGQLSHRLDPKDVQKSEIHKKVEQHIGKEIPLHNYRSNSIEHDGQMRKIGKLIKDKGLQQEFASDQSRDGARSDHTTFGTSTHRGVEVAGQTNAAPHPLHPTGHSWPASCKNVDTGSNRHYLEHEIKHGSVVHFIHDDSGKEIYRATLHPYHMDDDDGKTHTAYSVESEYGVKNPAFTKSAHDVATKLSSGKSGVYHKNEHVYDDSGRFSITHVNPETAHEDLHDMIKSPVKRKLAATSPHINDSHAEAIMKHVYDYQAQENLMKNPKVDVKFAKATLKSDVASPDTQEAAAKHAGLNHKDLHDILDNKNIRSGARAAVFENPSADHTHVEKGLNDDSVFVQQRAVRHEKATPEQISRGLKSEHHQIRTWAALNTSANHDHIKDALNDEHYNVRYYAAAHHNAKGENLDKALSDENQNVVAGAAGNHNASDAQLHRALDTKHEEVVAAVASNPSAKEEHLSKVLDKEISGVHAEAIRHPNMTPALIHKTLGSKFRSVHNALKDSPHFKQEHYSSFMEKQGSHAWEIIAHKHDLTHEHMTKIAHEGGWLSQIALANNPRATDDHIRHMTNDETTEVREAAKKALKRRGL